MKCPHCDETLRSKRACACGFCREEWIAPFLRGLPQPQVVKARSEARQGVGIQKIRERLAA